jgi:hypothetical protein
VAKVVQAKELQRRKPRDLPWLSFPVIRPISRIAIWVGISGSFVRSADGNCPGLGLACPFEVDLVRGQASDSPNPPGTRTKNFSNGSIIFNGSVHDYLGQPGVAAYTARKRLTRLDGEIHRRRPCTAQDSRERGGPGEQRRLPSGSAAHAPVPRQRNPQKFPTSSLPRFRLLVGASRKIWPRLCFFLPRTIRPTSTRSS